MAADYVSPTRREGAGRAVVAVQVVAEQELQPQVMGGPGAFCSLRGCYGVLWAFWGVGVARRERAEPPGRALFQAQRSAGRGVAGMDARFTPQPSGLSRGRFVECYGASPVRLIPS
jgi:hypothetical protein